MTEKQDQTKVNKTLKIIKIVIDVLLYAIVVTMLVFSISIISGNNNDSAIPNLFGRGYLAVLSESMEGEGEWDALPGSFDKGDLIFVRLKTDENVSKLKVGDVITFFDPVAPGNKLNTHRIIAIDDAFQLVTRGDKATSLLTEAQIAAENSTHVYQNSQTINAGAVRAIHYSPSQEITPGVSKGLGNTLEFMKSPIGFAVVIILPVLAILIYEGIKLARVIIDNNRKKQQEKTAVEMAFAMEQLELEKQKMKDDIELLKEQEKEKIRQEVIKEMEEAKGKEQK